jgi:hypothetical protein
MLHLELCRSTVYTSEGLGEEKEKEKGKGKEKEKKEEKNTTSHQ